MDNQKTASDEVDLSQLFSKIGTFFKNIGFGIIRFLAVLRNIPLKNKRLFISLTLIGGTVGFFYSYSIKKKFYESTMILNSDYLNKRIVDDAIEKFNMLADEKSSAGLANALNISDTLAKTIKEFEVRPFISENELIVSEVLKTQLRGLAKNATADKGGEKILGLEQLIGQLGSDNTHSFELIVSVYDHKSIKSIQDALVNFFKNNNFVKKRIEINKKVLEARRQKLVDESRKLDSLKKVIYANYRAMAEQTRQGSNNVILSDKSVTNPIEVHNQDLILNDQIHDIDKRLYLQPDFEVVTGLTEFNEPTNAGVPKVVAIGLFIGFGLGYVLVALMTFNSYLSKVE